MISLRSISKAFAGQSVLQGISMEIQPGDRLCIIGQSGSGKSVLMKLMVGLLEADSGEIWIDGAEVSRFDRKQWNSIIKDFGVVFQGAALFDSLNIFENVGIRMLEEKMVPIAEIRERVAAALEMVGLDPAEVLSKFPSELSGGMQKRVGIARAIVGKPKFIFYDEPTTGLDPVNSSRIDELIHTLAQEQGRSSIIITHDMYTVKTIATKVAFIHDQRLHFLGTPQEMFVSQDPVIQGFLSRSI